MLCTLLSSAGVGGDRLPAPELVLRSWLEGRPGMPWLLLQD